MRTLLHEYYGEPEYPDRQAKVFKNNDWYEVEFIEKEEIMQTRRMITNEGLISEVIHSESYAESAAENWVMGYMEIDHTAVKGYD